MNENLDPIVSELTSVLTTYGLSVAGAILILVIGLFIADRARGFTERTLSKIKSRQVSRDRSNVDRRPR